MNGYCSKILNFGINPPQGDVNDAESSRSNIRLYFYASNEQSLEL